MFRRLFKRLIGKTEKEGAEIVEKGRKVPLEIQLQHLSDLGISLNDCVCIDDILEQMDRNEIESAPYTGLLVALGSEVPVSENEWTPLSNNIWYFDTECIEDNGIYVQIMQRLMKMTQGKLKIINLKDYVDVEKEEAWIEFELEKETVRWDLEVDNDWFDANLLCKLNLLLKDMSSDKMYAVAVLDQTCLIGFFEEKQVKQLNDITGLKFETV